MKISDSIDSIYAIEYYSSQIPEKVYSMVVPKLNDLSVGDYIIENIMILDVNQ